MASRLRYPSSFVIALCSLPFVVFICSCGSLPPSQKSILSSSGPSSYCRLLHVPSTPQLNPPPKPYLGIYLSSEKSGVIVADCKDNTFVQVAGVIDGGPAEQAGMRKGDIILSLDGSPTCLYEGDILTSFREKIEMKKISAEVTLEVMREGQRLLLKTNLKERPFHNQQEAAHPDIGTCDAPSLLEKTLRDSEGFNVFEGVIDGLYQRSNIVHNPGWSYEKESNRLQLKEVTYFMRHPLASGAVANALTMHFGAPLHEKNWRPGETVRAAAALLDMDLTRTGTPDEITFPALLQITEETKIRVEHALDRLRPEERTLLQEKALRPWDDDKWNEFLDISMKLDSRELLNAFSPLLDYLTGSNLSLLKEDLIRRFGHIKEPVLFEAMTPLGKVIVGGPGPNVYPEDAALILDLGGDDLYLNNAGGTRPLMPVALVVDWEGDDRYITKENFSQGAGLLGGGFLLDLSGNDTFVSLDGSQGAGFFGVGLLYHGTGNSLYNSRSFSQGTGQMGIGLMVNKTGNNNYLCSHHGQGLGLFGGTGILIDETGDDYYQLGGSEPDFRDPLKSTVSMGQGFGSGIRPDKGIHGVPGGIGVLVDERGADSYVADYFAQGSSYYYGLGVLNDMDGNDQYISGRYSQGAGIHSSVGVFIDQQGDDFYYASFGVAQGMGHDYGVGFFEDDHGDDHYQGGTLVQGATTGGSIGVFIDGEGEDRHSYQDSGQGFAAEAGSVAIMLTTESPDGLKSRAENEGPFIRLRLKPSEKQ